MSTPFCVSPPNLAHRTKKHRKTCSKHRSPPLTSRRAHRRGPPKPPSAREVREAPEGETGGAEPRPYARLSKAMRHTCGRMWASAPTKSPAAYASYARAGRALAPLQPSIDSKNTFQNSGPWPPPTFAASRQRRDLIIAQTPGGCFQRGGPQPSLFGRSRMGDFQGGRKIETSFPLEWRFWLLLSLLTKVTRRRQKEKGRKESNLPEATEKEPKSGPVFPPGRP